MKLNLHHLFSTTAFILSTPLGAYSQSQNAFADMVETARAKFTGSRGGDNVFLRGHKTSEGDVGCREGNTCSAFGTELFLEVSDGESVGENILLSPLSVYNALVLVKDGATVGSESENQLEQVLGLSPFIDDYGQDGVKLDVATSLWADDLKQSYVKKMKSKHSSEAFQLPSTFTPINEWIEDETKGLIKDFMPASPGPVGPTLVSTVYFNGMWSKTFDPEDTIDGEFTLRDGSKREGRFMTDVRYVDALHNAPELGGASAVVLDYGKDDNGDASDFTSMLILPADDSIESMESALAGLNSQSLPDLLNDTTHERVKVTLPRFKINYGPSSLNKVLQSMGMKAAFDGEVANKFDRMTTNSLLTVGDVLHGAVMGVTELGTEAGAVTVVRMYGSSRFDKDPLDMNFNRPFVAAIIHRPTGTPVFLGKVESPDFIMEDPEVVHG